MDERNNKWLRDRLKYLWLKHFSDVSITNTIIIKFGRPARTRLGSIKPGRKYKHEHSIITINGYFMDSKIPEFVVDSVIAHEFMHYAHGFASPHQQAFKHPHKGGIVNWDMKERGLEDTLKAEKKWLKENWRDYILQHQS
jgi:predicted metal-dependent hydrolase